MKANQSLGVDVGGVIIAKVGTLPDTSFSSENFLQTPAMPDAFKVLRQLVDEKFGDNVFLVSKCGPKIQAKTLRWLKHHKFYEVSGVKPQHVHFCLQRADKETICRKLGITHFIDDRLDVLMTLKTVPNLYLFQTTDGNSNQAQLERHSIRRVGSWQEIRPALLASLLRRGERTQTSS